MDNAPDRLQPCSHMRDMVSAMADDSLRGWRRWYTRFHVSGCPRCRRALEAFRALRARLLAFGRQEEPAASLSPDRRSALERAWDEMEKEPK